MNAPDPVTTWPLVGRDLELASFGVAWGSRRCQAVAIHGPAGVGKSRVAEECLARALRGGFEGGRAAASPTAATVPLGAVAHLIPPGLELPDPTRAFAELSRGFSGSNGRRIRVLLVDDMQWLDAASAMLLRQLMDAGAVRIIGVVRTREPVSKAVAALYGGDTIHRIDLRAFDIRQTELALQTALGGPVVRRTVQRLHTLSGGNVLLLHELVLDALAAGTLVRNGETWELTGRLVSRPR